MNSFSIDIVKLRDLSGREYCVKCEDTEDEADVFDEIKFVEHASGNKYELFRFGMCVIEIYEKYVDQATEAKTLVVRESVQDSTAKKTIECVCVETNCKDV